MMREGGKDGEMEERLYGSRFLAICFLHNGTSSFTHSLNLSSRSSALSSLPLSVPPASYPVPLLFPSFPVISIYVVLFSFTNISSSLRLPSIFLPLNQSFPSFLSLHLFCILLCSSSFSFLSCHFDFQVYISLLLISPPSVFPPYFYHFLSPFLPLPLRPLCILPSSRSFYTPSALSITSSTSSFFY